MITKEELGRFFDRADLEVTDWQLELCVQVLNSDNPLSLVAWHV